MADRLNRIESDAAPRPVDRRQGWPGYLGAHFLVEGVALRKRNHGWVLPRGAQGALLHQGLGVTAGEVGEVAYV